MVNEQRSNLNRIATALAANVKSLANFDFVLIDANELAVLNIKQESTPGDTPDEEVNSAHVNLVELSVAKLVHLALVFKKKGESNRFQREIVTQMILQGIEDGNLDRNKIKIETASFWKLVD